MKKYLLLAVALFAVSCTVPDKIPFINSRVEGKLPVSERVVNQDFDKIHVSQSLDVEIYKSDVEKVVISAPQDLQEYIFADFSGSQLNLHIKENSNVELKNVRIKIYAKDFDELTADTSSDVIIKDKFTQEKTKVDVSTSASVSGDLEANDLEINGSTSASFNGKVWAVNLKSDSNTSSSIDFQGKAKNAVLKCSSSGSISGNQLVVENLDAEANSSGSIEVAVSESLKAEASSSGSIDVRKAGPLTVRTVAENSSGSVNIN